ncbi:CDP-alcohol phosphatidyltransferase [Nitzschia inconspicua]|uniref:CDP-alcohol phosphatidyltransferase n=1 Tax=Nitzschia inconspicua TaxID=303405 RepID=A0A9K3L0A3_9STRA|nr:CDP-alcohol phosphatidyltransferase [Nitzschia inconspicua]
MHLIEQNAAIAPITGAGLSNPLQQQPSLNIYQNTTTTGTNIPNGLCAKVQSTFLSRTKRHYHRSKSSHKNMNSFRTTTSSTTTADDVLLYVPNLIGYFRVVFTVTSLVLMLTLPQYWLLATALYVGSFVGDLFDGLVARRLNQTSTFGGLLDMVTDRCSTLGLLFVLANSYKDQVHLQLTFLFLSLLDISSHWCQMYSTSALGKHHKSEDGNEGRHFLVRWFYKYYFFFGYLCVGAEFTYVIAYALQFTQNTTIHSLLKGILCLVIPGCFMKQLVNVMQLASACYAVAQYDAEVKNK